MLKFDLCKLNNFIGDIKLHKKKVFNSRFFNNQSFVFKPKLICIRVKNIFHLFESQHFKKDVGFFLNAELNINNFKI